MIIGTKAEFEQLADFILRDYLGNTYDGYDPLDIQAFAKDYLKLDISYFAFDPDTGIEGMRTGNQIILDDRLLDDKKAGERNFTIAHECGHDLINWQDPSYSPQTVVNYRIKSSGKSLVTEDDFKEWQANVVASCLLLRPNLVGWSMFTFMRKDKVTVFDEHYLYPEDRYRLRICTRLNIKYKVVNMPFESEEDAISWICSNLLGRRSISEETRKYLIGKRYEAEKIMKDASEKMERIIRGKADGETPIHLSSGE